MTEIKQTTQVNEEQLKKIQELTKQKQADIVPLELDQNEMEEIEETFENVKDFRTL
jgi:enoyl-[acyl-carrier-protein] reductase (NADH)